MLLALENPFSSGMVKKVAEVDLGLKAASAPIDKENFRIDSRN